MAGEIIEEITANLQDEIVGLENLIEDVQYEISAKSNEIFDLECEANEYEKQLELKRKELDCLS
jgi:predicted  nucleic acid-binding Zn-ribbon protein